MYDFYCELCKDDGKNVEAEGYCIDCGEYFCGTCYSGHTRSRHTRYHKLLDKDSMPKDKPLPYERVSRFISTMCPVHSEKPVEYFCKTHNVLGCGACFLKSHKDCQDFESVLEKSECILASNEYKELLQNMKFISLRSNDMEETARDIIKEVKACYSKVIESINSLKYQVVATFERLAKDVTSKAAILVSEEEQKMTTLSAKCISISDSVNSLLAHFQSLESSKRVCQIYISMKQNKEYIDKLQAELHINEKSLAVRKFRFEPDLKFQEIVDNANALGKIMVENFVKRGRLTEPKPQTLPKTNDVTDIDLSSKLYAEVVLFTVNEGNAAKGRRQTVEIPKTTQELSEFSAECQVKKEKLTKPSPQTQTEQAEFADIGHSRCCTMPTLETNTSIVSRSKAVQVYCTQEAFYNNGSVNRFCEWLNPSGYEIHVIRAYSEVERKMPLIVLFYNIYGNPNDIWKATEEVLTGDAISLDRVAIMDMHTEGTRATPLWCLRRYYEQYGRVGMYISIECKSDGQINDEAPQRLHQFIEKHTSP